MSLLGRLAPQVEQRILSLSEFDMLLDRAYFGQQTGSGQLVNVDSALTTSAVWACVQAISKAISALPCHLYKWNPSGGKRRIDDHRVAGILSSPNDEQTPLEFWETMLTHRLTWGNAYAQIVLDGYGARELWILDPAKMKVQRNADSEALEYIYTPSRDPSKKKVFQFGEIFHLKGRSLDGVTGLSPVSYARQTIGLALAAEAFGSQWFGNSSNPGGFLQVDGTLSADAKARLKAEWEASHGAGNHHRVALLEHGLTWTQTTIPVEDSQFLATRAATKEDVATWFGVPPHKIGILGNSTRATIEEQNIEWVVDTILPECTRIEQAISRDLIAIGDGKRGVFAQFDLTNLLRGNLVAQADFYVKMRNWGIFNVDEIRDRLGMNPLPDGLGKIYITPMNMAPAGDDPAEETSDPQPGGAKPDPDDAPPPDALGDPAEAKSNGHHKQDFRDLLTLTGANGRYR